MPINLVRNVVWVLAVLGVLVGLARLTCLRWWQVPTDDPDLGASVAPTLRPGDWVILWRLTPPGFGDLVLCPDPEDASEIVIGRIVGEAGDQLTISDRGDIQINNKRMASGSGCKDNVVSVAHPRTGEPVQLRCEFETLGGVHHKRALMPSDDPKPLSVKAEVEQEQVYLVSDNRYFPFDSRDFGAVPRSSCTETFVFRLVSRLGYTDVESRLSLIQ